jgi:hypothetical protein
LAFKKKLGNATVPSENSNSQAAGKRELSVQNKSARQSARKPDLRVFAVHKLLLRRRGSRDPPAQPRSAQFWTRHHSTLQSGFSNDNKKFPTIINNPLAMPLDLGYGDGQQPRPTPHCGGAATPAGSWRAIFTSRSRRHPGAPLKRATYEPADHVSGRENEDGAERNSRLRDEP